MNVPVNPRSLRPTETSRVDLLIIAEMIKSGARVLYVSNEHPEALEAEEIN